MLVAYLPLARSHWRQLSFAGLLMALSSFGQTFFLAIFAPHMRAAFELSDGELGTVYAGATLAAGFALAWGGQWIDRIALRRFAILAAAMLITGCLAIAAAWNVAALAVAIFLVRLSGQGLMVHTAVTATARAFPLDRGKALGLTALGLPLGEAVLPVIAVGAVTALGWRGAWMAAAVVAAVGAISALSLLRDRKSQAPRDLNLPYRKPLTANLWGDTRFLLSLPAITAPSFIVTGFFFHQARLAEAKGWSLDWLASCFLCYALARAWSMLNVGPLIDRFGAVRLLPTFLSPLGLAMAVLAVSSQPMLLPIYMVGVGITSGVSTTLGTALWAEFYGVERLGSVRSTVAAANVAASALAPPLMGGMIDAGVGLEAQAFASLVYVALVSCLGWQASRVSKSLSVMPASEPATETNG